MLGLGARLERLNRDLTGKTVILQNLAKVRGVTRRMVNDEFLPLGDDGQAVPASNRLKFFKTTEATSSIGAFQISASPWTATATSGGVAGLSSTRTNGPSVSVKIRSRGMSAMRARPLALATIAGFTENQNPCSVARATSLLLPENQ